MHFPNSSFFNDSSASASSSLTSFAATLSSLSELLHEPLLLRLAAIRFLFRFPCFISLIPSHRLKEPNGVTISKHQRD
ncbi:hypothetical protein P8452_28031 [Trifolium repens]|nr:hypothetical protein P8452_28031 [Trifolium repens]